MAKQQKKIGLLYYIISFLIIIVVGGASVFVIKRVSHHSQFEVDNEVIEVVGATSDSQRAKYTSPLTIQLGETNLAYYNSIINTLYKNEEGFKREIVVRIALQLVEANLFMLDHNEYYFNTDYPYSGTTRGVKYYSLISYMNLINNGTKCYINNIGFVRLVNSFCAYAINPESPETVSYFSDFYGENFGFDSDAQKLNANSVLSGDVLFDVTTGNELVQGSTNRSMAIYLGQHFKELYFVSANSVGKLNIDLQMGHYYLKEITKENPQLFTMVVCIPKQPVSI